MRSTVVGIWCLGLVLAGVITVTAQTVDPARAEFALALLPEVTKYEIVGGHLEYLEGRLTAPLSGDLGLAATAFLESHRALYPAAPGSRFSVDWLSGASGSTQVMVKQTIDGFLRPSQRIVCTFNDGVLEIVEGVVLHAGDLPVQGPGTELPEEQAVEIARTEISCRGELSHLGSHRRLSVPGNLRSWTIDFLCLKNTGERIATAVTIDVFDGSLIESAFDDLMDGHIAGESGDGGYGQPESGSCIPYQVDGERLGVFSEPNGHTRWTCQSCGRWEYDTKREATRFQGNPMEYICSPERYWCDHGEAARIAVNPEDGFETAKLVFVNPETLGQRRMRLRWGPGSNDAVAFTVNRGMGHPAPPLTVTRTIDLSDHPTWNSGTLEYIALEIIDSTGEVWLKEFDLYPGPWLEFDGGPVLVEEDYPPDGISEFESIRVDQQFSNDGCDLLSGAHPEMRLLRYTLKRWDTGMWSPINADLCVDAAIPPNRTIPGGGGGVTNLCDFRLDSAGLYRLEVCFRDPAHSVPCKSTDFNVVETEATLGILANQTVEAYCHTCQNGRWDFLQAKSNPVQYSIGFGAEYCDLFSDERKPPVMVEFRRHDFEHAGCEGGGWFEAYDDEISSFGSGPYGNSSYLYVDVEIISDLLYDNSWQILDVRITLDPHDEWNEADEEDNVICVPAWIPVIRELDEPAGETFGSVLEEPSEVMVFLDDDFRESQQLPPGATCTGEYPDVFDCVLTSPCVEFSDPGWGHNLRQLTPTQNCGLIPTEPLILWVNETTIDEPEIAGVLIRYRRADPGYSNHPPHEFSPFPYAAAGTSFGGGVLLTYPFDDRSWSSFSEEPENQWHTAVWRASAIDLLNSMPFGPLPVKEVYDPNIWASSSKAGTDLTDLHFGFSLDNRFLAEHYGWFNYPPTFIGLITAWYGEVDSQDPPYHVRPLRLMAESHTQSEGSSNPTTWFELPGDAPVGISWKLAVDVSVAGGLAPVPTVPPCQGGECVIELTGIGQDRWIAVSPPEITSSPTVFRYYLQQEPPATVDIWEPDIGDYSFTVTVNVNDTYVGDNTIYPGISITDGCTAPVVALP